MLHDGFWSVGLTASEFRRSPECRWCIFTMEYLKSKCHAR
jgi:hypothetical protein